MYLLFTVNIKCIKLEVSFIQATIMSPVVSCVDIGDQMEGDGFKSSCFSGL